MVTKPKTKDVEAQTELASEPSQVVDIKHVFRVVSFGGDFRQDENTHPANVIEDYLKQNYFSQGYTLYDVEWLRSVFGNDGDIVGEQMLYILVKYAQ